MYPAIRAPIVRKVLGQYVKGITPETRHLYVLRHGACPPNLDDETDEIISGLDFMADAIWRRFGGVVDQMPADWRRLGRAAGPIRNRAMTLKLPRPDRALGFPWFEGGAKSTGTLGCMRLAHSANIPTFRVKVDGTEERYTGQPVADLPSLWQPGPSDDLPPVR